MLEAQQAADDIVAVDASLATTVDGMAYAMENIAYGVMYSEDFLQLVDEMMLGK